MCHKTQSSDFKVLDSMKDHSEQIRRNKTAYCAALALARRSRLCRLEKFSFLSDNKKIAHPTWVSDFFLASMYKKYVFPMNQKSIAEGFLSILNIFYFLNNRSKLCLRFSSPIVQPLNFWILWWATGTGGAILYLVMDVSVRLCRPMTLRHRIS